MHCRILCLFCHATTGFGASGCMFVNGLAVPNAKAYETIPRAVYADLVGAKSCAHIAEVHANTWLTRCLIREAQIRVS